MATKKSTDNSFADLVARLKEMSNMTPDQERASLMEAAKSEPKVLDDKEISLADIAKLAGIKEYTESPAVSKEAKKLVEDIEKTGNETVVEKSDIAKGIAESDADNSISANIKKAVNEESKRLDKIAELETQLAELKAEQKEEQTYDAKAFRDVISSDIAEYIKNAEEAQLVELYNTFSNNEAVYNEEQKNILVKTPETTEIIADAEKAEAPEEEVVQEKDKPEPSLNDLVKQGKLSPTKNINEEITYHDPCYLGRHNRIFDEPREILTAIPGLEIKELDRSRETSFCCGAGGGKVWMEEEAPRVNWNRFDEIQNHGVETVAAACPFCSTMFEDAAKYYGNETVKIKDIAELLKDSIDLPINNSNFEKLTTDSPEPGNDDHASEV